MGLRLASLEALLALADVARIGNHNIGLDDFKTLRFAYHGLRHALGISALNPQDDKDLDAVCLLETIAQRLEGKSETASLAAAIHQAVGAHRLAGEALKQAAE